MAKKRGKFSLNGVGTRVEQHAERVLRLVQLEAPQADPLAYASLLFLETRDPEKFKTLMSEALVASLYERYKTRGKGRGRAKLDAAETEQSEQAPKPSKASTERSRRKLALSGAGTLSEQHVDRVTRLWSVLLERNHNMYQYKTRVAFSESMQWLEANKPETFFTLLDSLGIMSNGDDAYFIFLRHQLNQMRKQVAASNEKLDLDIPVPTRPKETGVPENVPSSTEAMPPDPLTIFDFKKEDS